MSSQAVKIQIVGRQLQVNCPTGQEQALKNAATEFNTRVQELREKTQITNTEQLLMFSALNTSYELNSLKRAHEEIKEMNTQLQKKLDLFTTERNKNDDAVRLRINLLEQALDKVLVKTKLKQ